MLEDCKILFLAGSLRKDSLNKKLALAAYEIALDCGINKDSVFIDLQDYELPIYNSDLEINSDVMNNVIKLKEIFNNFQGIFIASPEYNGFFPPLLKNVLDWLSRKTGDEPCPNYIFQNKIVAIATATQSLTAGQKAMMFLNMQLSYMGAIVLPKTLLLNNAAVKFNEHQKLIDEIAINRIKEVISSFSHLKLKVN